MPSAVAFRYMGVPAYILTDNMKSVVTKRDWSGEYSGVKYPMNPVYGNRHSGQMETGIPELETV